MIFLGMVLDSRSYKINNMVESMNFISLIKFGAAKSSKAMRGRGGVY